MANETLALARQRPAAPAGESDYESFCAALGSNGRGRAFLAEYARRNRNADTEVLLAALHRLEAAMRGEAATNDGDWMRRELIALHDAIHAARGAIGGAAERADKLATLIEQTERHIAAMLALPQADPDLAIPSPANDEPRAAALDLDLPRVSPRSAAASAAAPIVHARPPLGLPEIDFIDGTMAPPPAVVDSPAPGMLEINTEMTPKTETVANATLMEFPAPGALENQTNEATAEKPAGNPLAGIMALSEAERLALFT